MKNSFWDKLNQEIIQGTQLLDTILESMASGVFLVNLKGMITYWNREAEKITGYNRNEILGRPCGDLPGEICGDGGCADGILCCGLFEEGELLGRECRITGKNGKQIILMKSARVVKDSRGRPFMGIVNLVDITKIKEANQEISILKSRLGSINTFENIVGDSPVMYRLFADLNLAAQSEASVLLTGESGTGKELAAEAIHSLSTRRNKPFVTVNCCSLPETLLESELFGHRKGAFTGAVENHVGRFEAANGGTVFIDEVGELNTVIQVKLLRFMQARTIERLGETTSRRLDLRIITATNQNLEELIREKKFREDLYYRINVFPITIPALKDRSVDIKLLVQHFMKKFAGRTGKTVRGIKQDTMEILENYSWPGNVRELENAIEHAFVKVQGDWIEIFDLPETILRAQKSSLGFRMAAQAGDLTRDQILEKLAENEWHRQQTANALGISRITLWKKMKSFGINN